MPKLEVRRGVGVLRLGGLLNLGSRLGLLLVPLVSGVLTTLTAMVVAPLTSSTLAPVETISLLLLEGGLVWVTLYSAELVGLLALVSLGPVGHPGFPTQE